ncbi:MAG TPA: DUF6443 domain-containing protein [Flavobacterium sp.]|uniref:DUF6443 domain-containing protein n=1 Tax=Flavobacterium sp. TaxID=239 RepID=UPI002C2347D6|nr:DUF6443 domain-containing protein [Flavobacterium sp.]HNP31805.1 DUF6443 domain-containing protein [Flavobacterium sp.]
MKKYIILFFYFVLFYNANAQNYIKTIQYKVPSGNSITSPTITQAYQYITFYDGLGRPIQEKGYQLSNTGKDIIIPIVYDSFGRESKQYLAYTNTSSSLNYETSALTDVMSYSNYSGQIPYSDKQYEPSPLDRVQKISAPGTVNDWAMGSNHEIRMDYLLNVSSDNVKIITANSNWDLPQGLYEISLLQNGSSFYPLASLFKNITKNENWVSGLDNTVEDYYNKEGQLLLKRAYENSVAHDTYYVYDQFGNLIYMIPPIVNGSLTAAVLNDLCYQYKYDYRNRLVAKKLPGKQWEFIVYDKLNRVIATGPTFSPFTDLQTIPPANPIYGWMITKYDVYNRPILTGWLQASSITNSDRKTLQDLQNSYTSNFSETKIQTTSDTTINGVAFRYTTLAWPTNSYHVLTVNYYDDYNYPNAQTIPPNIETQPVYYDNNVKPIGLVTGNWIRILETSTLYKFDLYYSFYDAKSRPLRIAKNNYLGGYTIVDSNVDSFNGKLNYTVTKHKRITTDNEIYVKDSYTYTQQDRMFAHINQIGSSGTPQLLSKNSYDELGNLTSQNVGGTDIINYIGMQKVDYSYNIRGWLTSINNVNSLTDSPANDLFAFKINYKDVENETNYIGTKLYNGNISETYWRTAKDDKKRKYGYKYDNLDRLINAIYQKPGATTVVTNSYNESVTYDKNGNISSINRKGDLDSETANINIDNLTYSYDPNKQNRLMKVFDSSNHPEGFKDDSDGLTDPADDYSYDDSGNLVTDQNKNIITPITYNNLNLPVKIVFGNDFNTRIEYLYDALGNKVKKLVSQYCSTCSGGLGVVTTDYLDGFVYNNNVLKFFPHEQGYVNNTVSGGNNVYNYVFNYTDHLGNIRLSYTWNAATNSAKILEENQFYPFGLKHGKYNSDSYVFVPTSDTNGYNSGIIGKTSTTRNPYQYKYNGNEFQDELSFNTYDYGSRNYDPAIGRWMTMDSMSEKFNSSTPYSYAFNSPLFYFDSDGLEPTPYEAALMAKHVYSNSGHLAGNWKRSSNVKYNKFSMSGGLKCALYERTKGGIKEFALVYAGTDDWTDVADDVLQGVALDSQTKAASFLATKVSNDLRNSEVTFVGHSLGGGLSNLSSLVTGRTSITFNPAWLSKSTKRGLKIVPLRNGSHVTNYINETDPLNSFQTGNLNLPGLGFLLGKLFVSQLERTGDDIILEKGEFDDTLLNGHSIDEIIDSLEDNDMDDVYDKYGNKVDKDEEGGYEVSPRFQ